MNDLGLDRHHSVSAPRSRQRMQDLKDRNRGPRLEPGISRALPVSLFTLNQEINILCDTGIIR